MGFRSEPASVTFALGQPVRWPPAPLGIAQVAELRRCNVRVVYRTRRGGRLRQPIVDAFTLDLLQDPRDPILPLNNLLGRGIVKPAHKTFSIDGPKPKVRRDRQGGRRRNAGAQGCAP